MAANFLRYFSRPIEHTRRNPSIPIQSGSRPSETADRSPSITHDSYFFSIFFSNSFNTGGNSLLAATFEPYSQIRFASLLKEETNALENRVDLAAGASVDFQGIVRGSEDGRKIDGIDYEAHREMDEHQLQQIAEQAAIEFGLRSVIIHHRIGFVAVGEPSLFTRVCSGHR